MNSLGKRKTSGDVDQPSLPTRPVKSRQTFVRHDLFWASDGNVLLQIANTRFKLHKSRLSARSPWFKCLFDRASDSTLSFPPFEGRDSVEIVLKTREDVGGVDLFYLDGLSKAPSARSFGELLNAMDAGLSFVYQPPNYQTLCRILTSSTFFHVHECLSFARTSLIALYPYVTSTSAAVSAVRPVATQHRPPTPSSPESSSAQLSPSREPPPTTPFLPQPTPIFDLASLSTTPDPSASHAVLIGRSFGLPQILPRAFYDLIRTPQLNPDMPAECILPKSSQASCSGSAHSTPSPRSVSASFPTSISSSSISSQHRTPYSELVKNLKAMDILLLVGLQKRMAEVWDVIGGVGVNALPGGLLGVSCGDCPCALSSSSPPHGSRSSGHPNERPRIRVQTDQHHLNRLHHQEGPSPNGLGVSSLTGLCLAPTAHGHSRNHSVAMPEPDTKYSPTRRWMEPVPLPAVGTSALGLSFDRDGHESGSGPWCSSSMSLSTSTGMSPPPSTTMMAQPQPTMSHRPPPNLLSRTRAKFPYDPISGLNALLKADFTSSGCGAGTGPGGGAYCPTAARLIRERIERERERVWDEVKAFVWLGFGGQVQGGVNVNGVSEF